MNQTVNQADQALARFASLDGENVSMTRVDFLYPEPEEILTCPGYPNRFVGNNVFYPADSKVGDNCLLGTKVMVPVGGPEVTNARIGNGCTIGRNSYVHYGVVMEDNVVIECDSFLMKGEHVPANSTWRGNPARERG